MVAFRPRADGRRALGLRVLRKLASDFLIATGSGGADDSYYRSLHGQLTLVPMPGFEAQARDVKRRIEEHGYKAGKPRIKVDIAYPKFGFHNELEPWIDMNGIHVCGHDCVVVASGPGTPKMIIQLELLLNQLMGRKAERISIALQYFPWSRSDKPEIDRRFALIRFMVDKLHNAAGTKGLHRLWVCDPHSSQMPAVDKSGKITPILLTGRLSTHVITEALKTGKRVCAALPDKGAEASFWEPLSQVEELVGYSIPRVVGQKRRIDANTTILESIQGDLDAVPDSVVIAFDDETRTLGSICGMGAMLRAKYKATTVWAAVTHGILGKDALERMTDPDCPINRTFMMNTIPINHRQKLYGLPELDYVIEQGLLTPISWNPDLADIIRLGHLGRNTRGLQ
ncbi:hypothetical protein HOI18_03315 [Candidatus Uhrbacteria bacterium]|jgi:phosphoribosylpyrophosphate synthetase|nr:hypothetical protein [Candidatus Uhrbacteria bacterium]